MMLKMFLLTFKTKLTINQLKIKILKEAHFNNLQQ